MEIPSATHPKWKSIVTGKVPFKPEFLAAQMAIGNALKYTKKDPSPENVQKYAERLRKIYATNANLPVIQNDLTKIFG